MSLLEFVFLSINFASIDLITGAKHCTSSIHHLSCVYDVADGQPLTVEKSDIRTLDLSGTSITELGRDHISDYANVVEINLSNCGIRSVGNASFSDLYKLIKLNLSDNLMTTFNADSFRDVNPLNVLVLSNNLLISLDSFSLDTFPKLNTLDLTGNALKYLPPNIFIKLIQDPSFNIFIYKNPWDCNDTHWESELKKSQYLKKNFCISSYDSALAQLKSGLNPNVRSSGWQEGKYLNSRETCGFLRCKWWIIGSLWIGVILGNLNKLNRLLYQSKCRRKEIEFFEKSVGTEIDPYHQLRQENIISTLEEVIRKQFCIFSICLPLRRHCRISLKST